MFSKVKPYIGEYIRLEPFREKRTQNAKKKWNDYNAIEMLV